MLFKLYLLPSKVTLHYRNISRKLTSIITIRRPMLGNFGAQKAKPKTNKATAEVNDEVPDAKEIEEKTFFQKYWYVLLGGAFLIMSIGAGPEPAAPPAAPRR